MAKGLLKRLEGRESVPQGLTTLALHARLIALTPADAPVAVHHKHGIRRGLKSVNRLGLRDARLKFYDAAHEADQADYTPETRVALRTAEQAYSASLQLARPAHVEQRYNERMAVAFPAPEASGGVRHG